MIEVLLKIYKRKITSYQLVFKFMKLKYRLTKFAFFLFAISALLMIYSLFLSLVWTEFRVIGVGVFIFFIFALSFLIFMTSTMNKRAKTIVRQKYNIEPNGWSWRTPKFEEMQIDLLKKYLNRHELYTENKLKLLITGLEKDIEKNKLPPLVNSGIFISLFVPIWIQYLTFRYKAVTTEEQAISILLFSAFLILLIIISVNFFKRISNGLKEFVIVDENLYKKMLLEKIEDTLLRYKEDKEV